MTTIIKNNGVHYTPKVLADFVADKIVATFSKTKKDGHLTLLDPAAGDGELLFSLTEALLSKDFHDFSVSGFDIDENALFSAKDRFDKSFPKIKKAFVTKDFLDEILLRNETGENFNLFAHKDVEHINYDIIIANPPYVRTQLLGAQKVKQITDMFNLTGRVDLYFAFIAGLSNILSDGGIAGLIVSNRFLSTKSGADVRKLLLEKFNIVHIYDLGDTKIFSAAVLPVVILLQKKVNGTEVKPANFTSIYETSNSPHAVETPNVLSATEYNGVIKVAGYNYYKVKQGKLFYANNPSAVWRISNEKTDNWIQTVQDHTSLKFGDIGKIKVGVKTCADKIFIRKDWDSIPENERPETELLLPLTTHQIANNFRPTEDLPETKILYPYYMGIGEKRPINLNDFPNTKRYLKKHERVLRNRDYLTKSSRAWYEIWVPHEPDKWKHKKIVFREISEYPTFWLDTKGTIVNGDCYWLLPEGKYAESYIWLLLAIANSSFIVDYYDCLFNNKLFANRRRFLTQYVENFPIPKSTLNEELISLSKKIFNNKDPFVNQQLRAQIDALTYKAFGLSVKEVGW